MRYVKQVGVCSKFIYNYIRRVGGKLFKKKSCGASPGKANKLVFTGITKEGFNTYSVIKLEKGKDCRLFGIGFRFLSKKSCGHPNQSIQHDLERRFQLGRRWKAQTV